MIDGIRSKKSTTTFNQDVFRNLKYDIDKIKNYGNNLKDNHEALSYYNQFLNEIDYDCRSYELFLTQFNREQIGSLTFTTDFIKKIECYTNKYVKIKVSSTINNALYLNEQEGLIIDFIMRSIIDYSQKSKMLDLGIVEKQAEEIYEKRHYAYTLSLQESLTQYEDRILYNAYYLYINNFVEEQLNVLSTCYKAIESIISYLENKLNGHSHNPLVIDKTLHNVPQKNNYINFEVLFHTFSKIRYMGKEYNLTANQAKIIKFLFEHRDKNGIHEKTITSQLEIGEIRGSFRSRNKELFGKLIKSNRGCFYLDLV